MKITIALGTLVAALIAYFFVSQGRRAPASIPEHKRTQFKKDIVGYEKPRASLRFRTKPIERTGHDTFILRTSILAGSDDISEIQYVWNLPASATIYQGDANGALFIDEVNDIEVEIGLEDPNAITNITLEAFYYQNGVKLGGVKSFQVNKPEEPTNKFKRTKAAFEFDLKKENQKIMQ